MMKTTYKIIMATQILVLTMISKGTSMDEPTNESSSTLPTSSEVTNHPPINNPVDLHYFMGEPEMEFLHGYSLWFGLNIPKNQEQGLIHMQNAANRGHHYAQYKMGKMYLRGNEIPQNLEKGLELLHLSADQGLFDALNDLGKMYLTGDVIPQNTEKAQEYLEKAEDKIKEQEEFRKTNPEAIEKFKNQMVLGK